MVNDRGEMKIRPHATDFFLLTPPPGDGGLWVGDVLEVIDY